MRIRIHARFSFVAAPMVALASIAGCASHQMPDPVAGTTGNALASSDTPPRVICKCGTWSGASKGPPTLCEKAVRDWKAQRERKLAATQPS